MASGTDDAGAVRAALASLLDWDEMKRSPQLANFLRYVVDAKLAGDEHNIKAYAVAVDVFGRPPSFDPQADPIVRVQARRLRRLLDRYYESHPSPGGVEIHLPVGRYVPEFRPIPAGGSRGAGRARNQNHRRPAPRPDRPDPTGPTPPAERDGVLPAPATPNTAAVSETSDAGPTVTEVEFADRPNRHASIIPPLRLGRPAGPVVALSFVLLAIVAAIFDHGPPPGPSVVGTHGPEAPVVFVGSFSNLVNARTPDPVAEGLRDAVAADLAAFPEFSVATVHNARPPPASALFLTGVMRPVAGGIEVSLLLSPRVGGAATWTTTVEASFDDTNLERGLADAARRLVSPIAAFNGPLLAGGRAWFAAQREVEDQPTPFACLLRFRAAGSSGSAIDHGRAALCFERLLARNPRDGDALAVSAWYTARRALQQAAPGDNLLLALRPASDMARAALTLAPGSALAQAMAGRALSMAGQDEAARRALIAALSLSPANLDVRAAYAWVLGTSGEWRNAEAEAGAALTAAPEAPPWYHAVPSLGAYRRGDYVRAADEALAFSRADDLMAPILAVAAGARAHRGDLVNRFVGHLLADPVYRRSGIIAPLALRLHDTQLLHDIADGLSLAGVPQASIWGSF